ncbi:hypothetical protein ACN4EG_06805 [Alkalinema pantanalense CENA528]|uniref:hypothetical protein n=1 Tax=Alkalinema pantanalense TaxID=1620705 RepID=UPI003D6FC732
MTIFIEKAANSAESAKLPQAIAPHLSHDRPVGEYYQTSQDCNRITKLPNTVDRTLVCP